MHPSTAANGYCPCAVAITFEVQLRAFILFATNRALPSFRRWIAWSGVMAACDAAVWTSAAPARPASEQERPTRRTARERIVIGLLYETRQRGAKRSPTRPA